MRSRLSPTKGHLLSVAVIVSALFLALVSVRGQADPVGGGMPASPASQLEATNSLELVRLCLSLQEQLRVTQAAIEESRAETKAAAVQTAEALSNAFQAVEVTFATQRTRDLEAMAASNRVTLVVAGAFTVLGFLTMVLVGYFQWRMSKGLAEISAALPLALGLGAGVAAPALGFAGVAGGQAAPGHTHTPTPLGQPHLLPRGGAGAAPIRFFSAPVPAPRKRPVRPLRTAVIVGLICAAVLALLFYAVTCQRPGSARFYQRLKL